MYDPEHYVTIKKEYIRDKNIYIENLNKQILLLIENFSIVNSLSSVPPIVVKNIDTSILVESFNKRLDKLEKMLYRLLEDFPYLISMTQGMEKESDFITVEMKEWLEGYKAREKS